MLYLLLFAIVAMLAWDVVRAAIEDRRNWREVLTGRAGIAVLRALTGIADRHELVRRFGAPDPEFRFAVLRDQVLEARTPLRRLFDHGGVEMALLAMALLGAAYGTYRPASPIWFALLGPVLLYFAAKDGNSLVVLIKSHRQRLLEARAKLQRVRGAPQS